MSTENEANASPSYDNGVDNGEGNTQREPFSFDSIVTGDSCHAASQSQPALFQNTTNEESQTSVPATAAAAMPVATAAPVPTAVTNKGSRKAVPRSKQHLLAGTDFFLKEGLHPTSLDDSIVLQGHVLECPNKCTNAGRHRIDWQKNTVLPPSVKPEMLREWYPSTKDFREKLDKSMKKWMDEATEEQKSRVSRKRKTLGSETTPRLVIPQTPPSRREHLEARAAMRTEASTATSSLSSRSGSFTHGHNLLDRRPPRAPSPSSCADAAISNDDCSFAAASMRSTLGLDSDSDDVSQLDEQDDLHEHQSDSEEEEDDDCRPHVEAPDLSERARGCLGDHPKASAWKFELVTETNQAQEEHRPHSGPHGLRAGVADKFNDPFECFSECGGCAPLFVARLAANSNDCCCHHMKPDLGRNRHCNDEWRDITAAEMHHFLGIVLKISLSSVDGGGCAACFAEEDKVVCADSGRRSIAVSISNSQGWAQKTMKLNRFKQVRGAFHPEDKTAGIGKDKCCQLRHVLNQLNALALSSFHMGPNMAFDEGGVACRSRFCPARQHNKDKPDKCRVDFFVLNDSKHHFIYHMDVCQGKNKHNAYIHKRAADLPATQKAVVNALFKTDLSTPDPLGYRHLASDNRCTCPELLCMLRDKCRTCGTGTCRKKRKGWDSTTHNMTKNKDNRGGHVLSCDSSNQIICGEWMDSKVVTFATSVMDTSSTTMQRRIGSQKKNFPCPAVFTHCQRTVGGVDKGDQMRLHGGGFARKAHFKSGTRRRLWQFLTACF